MFILTVQLFIPILPCWLYIFCPAVKIRNNALKNKIYITLFDVGCQMLFKKIGTIMLRYVMLSICRYNICTILFTWINPLMESSEYSISSWKLSRTFFKSKNRWRPICRCFSSSFILASHSFKKMIINYLLHIRFYFAY